MTARPDGPTHCGAIPHEGLEHEGRVRRYVRVCTSGHLRLGLACDGCHGQHGAVLCNECPDDEPALLIPAETFQTMGFGAIKAAIREGRVDG